MSRCPRASRQETARRIGVFLADDDLADLRDERLDPCFHSVGVSRSIGGLSSFAAN